MTAAEDAAKIHMLDVRDDELGDTRPVRFHGQRLARDGDHVVYVTEDDAVLVYDERDQCLYGFDDGLPAPVAVVDVNVFRIEPRLYAGIIAALGVDPAIDIGRRAP